MNDEITVVDYGHGNLGSIVNMLKKIGQACVVAKEVEQLEIASKIILPGVGAFDSGMKSLEDRGFDVVLKRKASEEKVPLLGICLGMQMLGESSDEGGASGLGLVKGSCKKFPASSNQRYRIPCMGWNQVRPVGRATLFEGCSSPSRFYFVHSYYFQSEIEHSVSAIAEYGFSYAASIEVDNIFGVQFHPEKSHKFGMQLLRNFVGVAS